MGQPERAIVRSLLDLLAGLPLFVVSPFRRRQHLRWGATDEEVERRMPGDEIVRDPSFSATRAISIDAPPEAVWPWLVQVGFGRAGFYSYDLLDNAARPSATRILPAHQSLEVGDRVPMASKVTDATAFTVAALEPCRSLIWVKPHSTWAWTLTPTSTGGT